jgi:hypothetical protein
MYSYKNKVNHRIESKQTPFHFILYELIFSDEFNY